MKFIELSESLKAYVFILLYVLNFIQLVYLILLKRNGNIKKFIINIFFTGNIFFIIVFLGETVYNESGFLKNINVGCLVGIAIATILIYISKVYAEIKRSRGMLTEESIKEAFDDLPSGICFFSKNGLVILCNLQMHRLVYLLTGKDLQTIHDLRSALEDPQNGIEITYLADEKLYCLPDQSVWRFTESEVTDQRGNVYIQIIATNLTRLYELQRELDEKNIELKAMIEQMQRIAENVAEIIRNQEILTAKIRVHNKMGNSLLSARRYILQECPEDQKENLISIWTETLEGLQNEIGQEDNPGTIEDVIHIGKSIGVDIVMQGSITQDKKINMLLIAALRECLTNTVRHAQGSRLEMKIEQQEGLIKASYTNNGKPPKKKITEGGGLSFLRLRIEEAGGYMKIKSSPDFELIIILRS